MPNLKKFLSLVFLVSLFLAGCGKVTTEDKSSPQTDTRPMLGVWWWQDELIDQPQYLEFAAQNGVTEIYFCTGDFSARTAAFIAQAGMQGIKVFLLCGEHEWIDDSSSFDQFMQKYLAYQNSAANKAKFAGVHLDVEPQQKASFATDRAEILKKYLAFVIKARTDYRAVSMDFDIPFWFDDELSYKGNAAPLYAAVIAEADRVFIMSYRDTAAAMLDVSKDEISCARALGKNVILGAETYSTEGDPVSYQEEGRQYMYSELAKLRDNSGCGIAIHSLKSWYELDD
jgi:hypothetical protein